MNTPSDHPFSAAASDPDGVARTLRLLISFEKAIHARSDHAGLGDSFRMLNESGLTLSQFIALQILQSGAHSVCEIADKARLSRPAASHMVDRLVTLNLVLRVENERDRRQKQVSLTEAGSSLVTAFTEAKEATLSASLAALTPSTRARFAEVLADVVRELKPEAAASAPSPSMESQR